MTETSIVIAMPRNCKNFEGCGRLLSNVEAKIICTETGEILGPNQTGEICIKSPMMMKGYFKNQEATDNTLKNGWIRTGDVGYYDEEEFFYVTDRLKNIIKVDGCQVSTIEIENELQKHPLVEECSVIGKPDSEHGEVPLAFGRTSLRSSEIVDHILFSLTCNSQRFELHLSDDVILYNRRMIPRDESFLCLILDLKE
ncbi:Luciferin 4-monooxygenase [Armadillidium nasatum]|uniref:Luciferin 4-monooxygenase n=1 Tax=Armadillidium nasatum TaxID=96803 RepID=A0A5N5TC63_9CRUS|nr:Luciferin 4-monooxygenase [Armadillidium nasatum]